MSDSINDFLDAAESAPANDAPADDAPTETTTETTPEVRSEVAPETADPETFPRDYVEKLRREAAEYRTKAKESADRYAAFEDYSDEDRATWTDLAKALREDPQQAAQWMREIADAVGVGDEGEGAPPAAPSKALDSPYMTKAEYERVRQEERQQADVARVESEADALGYGQNSRDRVNLFLIAREETNGDLKAAHEKIQAEKASAADEAVKAYLASKQADAEGSPDVPSASGNAPSGERQIKTFKDARAGLEELIASQKHS